MRFEGHLSLCAEGRGDRTVLTRQSFRAPFHISKPYDEGGVLQVQIVNPTAGILEGDVLDLELCAGPGARLCVGTPSAARAFRVAGGGTATCRQLLRVEQGGCLEYAPEPLYPHAGADYRQETRLEVAEGGSICFVDTLAPGRAARGELWAWRSLRIALDVFVGGKHQLRERLDLGGPELGALAAAHGFTEAWLATVVLVSPDLPVDRDWWAPLRAEHRAGLWAGLSRLGENCWVLRLVASHPADLREALARVRGQLSRALPALRAPLRRV